MEYGLQFTTTTAQSWFSVWFDSEEKRDEIYENLQKVDWRESGFNAGDILVNLNHILTIKKIGEEQKGLELPLDARLANGL